MWKTTQFLSDKKYKLPKKKLNYTYEENFYILLKDTGEDLNK